MKVKIIVTTLFASFLLLDYHLVTAIDNIITKDIAYLTWVATQIDIDDFNDFNERVTGEANELFYNYELSEEKNLLDNIRATHNFELALIASLNFKSIDLSKYIDLFNDPIEQNTLRKLYSDLNLSIEELLALSDQSIFFIIYSDNSSVNVPTEILNSFNDDGIDESILDVKPILKFYYWYLSDEYSSANKQLGRIDLSLIPTSKIKYKLLRQIGYSLSETGDFSQAIEIYKSNIQEFYLFPNEVNFLKKDIAYYYYSIGRLNKAKTHLKQIVNANKNLQLSISNNLALIYYREGKNTLYLSHQLESEALAIELEDYYELLNIYRNLHIFHKYNKNWASALLYLEKAKELINEQDFGKRELSALYRSIGDFYWESEKDLDKALSNLDYSLSIIDPENYYYDYFYNLQVKAKFLEASQLYSEAEKILNEMILLSNSRSDQYNYLITKIDLAYLTLKKGSTESIQSTLIEIESYDLSGLEFTSLVKNEYLELSLENKNERLNYGKLTAIVEQILERSKNSTLAQGGYWKLEPEYSDIFEFAADKYSNQRNYQDLVKLFDSIKTINDVNYFNNSLITSSKLSNEALDKVSSLNEDLSSLRNKLLSTDQTNQASIQAEIDLKSAQLENLRTSFIGNNSKINIPYWNIQKLIKADQAVLYFTQIKNHIYKIQITKSDFHSKKITFSDQEISKIEHITESLATKNTDLNDLYDFYQKLEIGDIEQGINEIIVIPDSYLLQIPIDILPTIKPENSYSYGAARYLIEDYLISYVSSIEEFYQNHRFQNSSFENTISAFGISDFDHIQTNDLVPLPYAEQEIKRVGKSLENQKQKLLLASERATKETFLKNAPGSKVIHLATHSEVSNEDPIYSTLYFEKDKSATSDSTDDGTLYAYELYNLNLHSDLIFLNSCSSGSGNYLQGTGVMGINRALRYAGAKSLLLNLWPVNDNVASGFAENFYSELAKGISKPEALRNAKLTQLKEGSADPHYWGVYMLIGNPSPVFEDPSNKIKNASTYSILALLLSISIIVGYRKKNR